jgi:hypothetical protein
MNMSTSSLFIPKKIRVGYQHRDGTYTKKLAYVIYYDLKGKLHKEKSWLGWCDAKIPYDEYDNEPTDGFVLNKGIQRYGWSHFSSNRSYIRIYDPRGIEFEITPENLIGILMETTCSRRGLDGQFVYAWQGDKLVLLPCGSEEYQKAMANTKRQAMSVSARDLKPGCSYMTKKGSDVIYIGRFNWFEWSRYGNYGRKSKKMHIFAHPQKPSYGHKFFPKSDATFLAACNNPDPLPEYAELLDEFNGDIHSSVITAWETSPLEPKLEKTFDPRYGESLKRTEFAQVGPDCSKFVWWRVEVVQQWDGVLKKQQTRGYRVWRRGTFDTKTLRSEYEHHQSPYYGWYGSERRQEAVLTEQQVLEHMSNWVEVDMVLSSGKKLRMVDLNGFQD